MKRCFLRLLISQDGTESATVQIFLSPALTSSSQEAMKWSDLLEARSGAVLFPDDLRFRQENDSSPRREERKR